MNHLKQYSMKLGLWVIALSVVASTVLASSGGGYTLDWYKVSGGGGTISGDRFNLTGAIGQAEAGMMSGGSYNLTGGFLFGAPRNYTVYLPLAVKNFINYFNGPWEVEPNNSSAEANGPLRSGQDYFGYSSDAKDYFSFISSASGSIAITLTNYIGGNGQLQLFYQSTGNLVAYDATAPFNINYNGPAGLYYIYISTGSNFNNVNPYTLRVTYP
jgi:hypothetical protein